MPKRTDIKTILILGSGPIVIGQACEFDYSGVQACQALRSEGYKVVLLNSNPATIMTDDRLADATYIEPLKAQVVQRIVKKEKVDAILSTMGGQTALNLAMNLSNSGFLEQYGVELIGACPEAIEKAENRQAFYELMKKNNIDCPFGIEVSSIEDAKKGLEKVTFPLIIRPSFTLGGKGVTFSHNYEEYIKNISQALKLSPIQQVLVEESVEGWKEYEMEVIRDKNDNCIIVCSIENIDPMGVHTGDSITVAPAMTLTDKEYQKMRDISFKVLRLVGVETGGSNVQFAVHPQTGKVLVIEMNPRVSRSSALASKATGYPIAKVAARLAIGYTLDEIRNEVIQNITAAFEPSIDYIVTKIPRFDFEKFPDADQKLSTSMKSVGEVMGIGHNFESSLHKAICSLNKDYQGLDNQTIENLLDELKQPQEKRLFFIADALRQGFSINDIHKITGWDKWFLDRIKSLVNYESIIIDTPDKLSDPIFLRQLKSLGFTNERLSFLSNKTVQEIENFLTKYEIFPCFRRIDTCAAEFPASTSYLYSSYSLYPSCLSSCESIPSNKNKVIIIGSGPNHIGQGIEFDYCCVEASSAIREMGYESIMINCNPETVSTDHTISDKLYFSPLIHEHIMDIIRCENKEGRVLGVLVQFGGQTSIKLAKGLKEQGVKILGTYLKGIDIAEDRKQCREMISNLGYMQPKNIACNDRDDFVKVVKNFDGAVILRPSYVIGGQNMEIVLERSSIFESSIYKRFECLKPILVEEFLSQAKEIEVDAICDGKDCYIAGIVEHYETAGIHSGDSSCILPAINITSEQKNYLKNMTFSLAKELGIKGFINIQFVLKDNNFFIIEINPRASRTIPFLAKATGLHLANIATKVILGMSLEEAGIDHDQFNMISFAVKQPYFSFDKLLNSDPKLSPEMKSTGEAMFLASDLVDLFEKSNGEQYRSALSKVNHVVMLTSIKLPVEKKEKIKSYFKNNLKAVDEYTMTETNLSLISTLLNKNSNIIFITDILNTFLNKTIRNHLMHKNVFCLKTEFEIDLFLEYVSKSTNGKTTCYSLQDLIINNKQINKLKID